MTTLFKHQPNFHVKFIPPKL